MIALIAAAILTFAPPDSTFMLGSDTAYQTPVYRFKGVEAGPVMVIDAGIHGDEVAPQYAADSLVKYLTIQKGTLYLIPRTNLPACNDTVRFVNMDLNRSFPGDSCWTDYEPRLAHDFMRLIATLQPNLVLNLHEARTSVVKRTPKNYNNLAFGQTLIAIDDPLCDMKILAALALEINKRIAKNDRHFKTHRFKFMPGGSLDNIVYRLKIPSYTVETWRGYPLPDRIKMQLLCCQAFISSVGLEFDLPKNIQ